MLPLAILAGGLATRLRPVTEQVPKALISVGGEPFLAHQLRLLRDAGIQRAVLCVGYLGEKIQEYAGDGSAFGLSLTYSFDGPTPLGTAGAIRKALPYLGEAFFVLYGDSYLLADFRAIQEALFDSRKDALMTVFRNEGRWDNSNVEYRDDEIIAYDKHARTERMQHIDYGLGAFRREAFETGSGEVPSDLFVQYQSLLKQGRLAGYEVKDRFYEVGSWAGIQELEAFLTKPGATTHAD